MKKDKCKCELDGFQGATTKQNCPIHSKNWEEEFDNLLDGMAPKVNNFGSFKDERAKKALQAILTHWWGNADSYYREPLKEFIRKLLED